MGGAGYPDYDASVMDGYAMRSADFAALVSERSKRGAGEGEEGGSEGGSGPPVSSDGWTHRIAGRV